MKFRLHCVSGMADKEIDEISKEFNTGLNQEIEINTLDELMWIVDQCDIIIRNISRYHEDDPLPSLVIYDDYE